MVITGRLPEPESNKLYRLQIGAFAIPWNASIASGRLKDAGFNPSHEQYMHFTRVVITGVHAKDVPLFIERIGALGFRELFIAEETAISETPVINEPMPVPVVQPAREVPQPVVQPAREPPLPPVAPSAREALPPPTAPAMGSRLPVPVAPPMEVPQPVVQPAREPPLPPVAPPLPEKKPAKPGAFFLDEKWDVVSANSPYISFEFTHDSNYIVVEKNDNSIWDIPLIHFGEYKIQDSDTIDLKNQGILKIKSVDNDDIYFTFMPNAGAGTSGREKAYEAKKAASIAESPKTDLLCRTWKIQRLDGKNVAGTEDELVVLYSKAGTYLISYPDGEMELAQWRWKDWAEDEFLYSWHNWKRYGSAKISRSAPAFLEFSDPGYDVDKDGYTAGEIASVYELIPIRN
jgi:hypothetical protein